MPWPFSMSGRRRMRIREYPSRASSISTPQAGPVPSAASIVRATLSAVSFAFIGAAMAYETIEFKLEAGIARLTLSRPDRLNSFTVRMHEEVADALSKLEGARVLVLSGAGRGFCAGQDLNDRAVAPGESVDLGHSVERRYNPLIRRLTTLPLPVIARVNGVAAGAGANIALACDIVIAAQSAKFIQSFAKIGLI